MLIGFFTFEVVVFDGSNHILSEGDVAANVVTLEAFTVKFVPSTIHGVVNDSRGSLIIVFSIKAQEPGSEAFAPPSPWTTTYPSIIGIFVLYH